MSDLEARIAEVLAGHDFRIEYQNTGARFGTIVCNCGNRYGLSDSHRAHIAERINYALAPVIAEVRKDERSHVMQEIRECEYEPPQIDDYGRVELEGYITVTNTELDAIDNGAGFDRMCMSVTDWETGLAAAFKRGFDDAHNQHTAHQARRNQPYPPITYTNPCRSNDE